MEREEGDLIAKDRLGLQLAERMRAIIRTGEWGSMLPGIRVLMERFGVSRVPVLEAMTILEEEGWIGPAFMGKQREILFTETSAAEGVILFCRDASNAMAATNAWIYQDLDGWFLRNGVAVQQVIRDPRKPLVFEQTLKEVFQKTPAVAGVVALGIPHPELRRAIGPHCPLLLMGSRQMPDDNCADIATRLIPMVDQAVRHLFAQGIKRLCLVICNMSESLMTGIREVARAAFEEAKKPFDVDLHVAVMRPGNVPFVIREVIRKEQPEVLLTIGDDHWSRLQWEVHEQGAATRVLALWDSPQFKKFEKPPAVFALDVKDFTEALQRWHQALQRGADYRFTLDTRVQLLR